MGCGGGCKQSMVKDTHKEVKRLKPEQAQFNLWEAVLDFLDFRDLLQVAPTCRIIHHTSGKPEILRKFQVQKEHKQLGRLDTLTEYQFPRPGTWFAIDTLAGSLELTPKFLSPTGLKTTPEGFKFCEPRHSVPSGENRSLESVSDSLDSVIPLTNPKGVLTSISEIAELDGFPMKVMSSMSVTESAHFKPITEQDETDHSRADLKAVKCEFSDVEEFKEALWKAVCEGRDADLTAFVSQAPSQSWLECEDIDKSFGSETVSLLAVAVSTANTELVSRILQYFPKLNPERGYEQALKGKNSILYRKLRPIQFACARGVFPIVQLLLARGSDPNESGVRESDDGTATVKMDFGTPPLLICVNSKFYNSYLRIAGLDYATRITPAEIDYFLCAKAVLDAGGKPDICTNDPVSPTPLFSATERTDMLKVLLESHADPNVTNNKGHTPLYLLSERQDDAESVKVMVEHGAMVDPPTCRPLFIALSLKHLGTVKALRHYGAQVNGTEDSPSALQVAVSANDAALCRMILGWSELQIDWTYRQNGKNMFHRIAQVKGHEVFDLLVAHRSLEEFALIAKALNQSTALDSTEGDTTPVLYAFPDLKLVRKMVDYGSNIKRLNLLKCIKAYRGEKPIVQALLDYGLDPNIEWEGQTPIWFAHEEGKFELLLLLCKSKTKVDEKGRGGLTLLQEACLHGNLSETRILFKHGADPSSLSAEGKSAVDYGLVDYPGKNEDIKTQLMEMFRLGSK